MKRARRRRLAYALAGTTALGLGALFAVPRLLGPRVQVVHAATSPLVQTVVTTGRVMAPAEIETTANISAMVEEVLVDKGDRVKRGDLLVRLDDADAKVALAQARAALARARAQRRQVRSVSAPVRDQRLSQARARRDDAERRHRTNEALFAQGAIAKAELDRSATELALAESALAAASTEARAAAPGGPEAASASATIELAEADVRAAEVQLERTRILAPVDGVVLLRSVEPGERAAPGRTLLTLARTGLTQLVIEPDEKNLSLLRVGQPATASAEAYPDRSFPARLSFIAPSVDPKRGTVEVRLEVQQPPDYLRPDMTVSVEVEVAKKASALVLDAGAVRDLAAGVPWVLVVRDGRAERVDVELGLRGDRQVEILDGIGAETPVVPVGEARVAPGARVRIAPE